MPRSRPVDQLVDWLRENPRKAAAAVVVGALLGYLGFQVVGSMLAWNAIASEDFDPDRAAVAIEQREPTTTAPSTTTLPATTVPAAKYERLEAERMMEGREVERPFTIATATSPSLPDEMFTSVLLVGTDESGFLADVIIYGLLPADGSAPLMVSIPRDLYLPNRCTGEYTRVNASLGGCSGVASGMELLALTVGDFTGIEVDHFARVNFDGFKTIIDRMGGVTVCVGDHAVRDPKSGLDLGPGCHQAGGGQTLAWIRSRNTQYLIDGEWVTPGGSDFDRHRKGQDVLFQLADRLSSYSSVASLASALQNLSSAVRMDSGWSVSEAAQLAFRYRGISRDQVRRFSIPVRNHRTGGGALVLLPTRSFNDVLSEVYPPAAR